MPGLAGVSAGERLGIPGIHIEHVAGGFCRRFAGKKVHALGDILWEHIAFEQRAIAVVLLQFRPGVDGILYEIVDRMVDGFLPAANSMSEELDDIEDEILRAAQARQSREIVELRAKAGRLRRLLIPQLTVIQRLSPVSGQIVVIGDMPYPREQGIDCLTRNPGNALACGAETDYAVTDEFQVLEREVAEAHGAEFINVIPWFCADGFCPAVIGGLIGGLWMVKLGINRALWLFGVVQLVSIFGFAWLAWIGRHEAVGAAELAQLALVIGFEALGVGLGTAAFVAFIARATHPLYTATQFALLSAFASVGRVWVGPLAGVLAESIGWPAFFIVSTVVAVPALLMLWWLRASVRALEVDPATARAADG